MKNNEINFILISDVVFEEAEGIEVINPLW